MILLCNPILVHFHLFNHDLDLEHAVGAKGFVCGISFPGSATLTTDDTLMFAAPGGRAVLMCKVKGDNW
jgi:hypothetical protein